MGCSVEELIGRSKGDELRFSRSRVGGEPFGDGCAETTEDGMLFKRGHDPRRTEDLAEDSGVERLQRSHAGNAAADTPTVKLRCRFHGQRQGVAKCEDPHLFAFANAPYMTRHMIEDADSKAQ